MARDAPNSEGYPALASQVESAHKERNRALQELAATKRQLRAEESRRIALETILREHHLL